MNVWVVLNFPTKNVVYKNLFKSNGTRVSTVDRHLYWAADFLVYKHLELRKIRLHGQLMNLTAEKLLQWASNLITKEKILFFWVIRNYKHASLKWKKKKESNRLQPSLSYQIMHALASHQINCKLEFHQFESDTSYKQPQELPPRKTHLGQFSHHKAIMYLTHTETIVCQSRTFFIMQLFNFLLSYYQGRISFFNVRRWATSINSDVLIM